eukprot:c22026_g1_i1 orf=1-228(-)
MPRWHYLQVGNIPVAGDISRPHSQGTLALLFGPQASSCYQTSASTSTSFSLWNLAGAAQKAINQEAHQCCVCVCVC